MAEKEKLIVILGPTAVGKTALAVNLAQKLATEIISGDSMLVYKGFDIGTAKPDAQERQGIRHHLIDILEPWQEFSVTQFKDLAGKLISDINARGMVPVLAGGTGLYVKSLLENYQFNTAPEDAPYRAVLELLAEQHGKAYVHEMLAEVDPATAARLHVNDFRRVVRALEVATHGDEYISQSKEPDGELAYDVYAIGLDRDRQKLYDRIDRRVCMMFENGLADEVRGLLAQGLTREAQAMKGIGYKETAAWLAGEMTKVQAIEAIQKATRHFAKRQLTWYRKMPYIHWYKIDDMTETELLAEVSRDIAGFFPKR
jgi:tRNA dimethylallyltransferase